MEREAYDTGWQMGYVDLRTSVIRFRFRFFIFCTISLQYIEKVRKNKKIKLHKSSKVKCVCSDQRSLIVF